MFILLLVSICNPPCIIYFLIKGPHPSPPSPLWWCGRRRFPLRHWSLLGPGWQKDGPRHMGPVQRERWQEGKGEKTIGADAEHVPREAYRALDISLTHVHRGCRHRPAGNSPLNYSPLPSWRLSTSMPTRFSTRIVSLLPHSYLLSSSLQNWGFRAIRSLEEPRSTLF